MQKPTVLIADDHAMIVDAFRKLLEPYYDIIATVSDGRALLEKGPELKPDVIIIDIGMPCLNGLAAGQRLRDIIPKTKMVYVTMNEDGDLASEALRSGAAAPRKARPSRHAPVSYDPEFEDEDAEEEHRFVALDGNAVLTGPDGIFMVDASFEPLHDKVVAAIRQFSNAPIRFLVNTHVHPDHVGGDAAFAKMGVTILSRPEVRDRMSSPTDMFHYRDPAGYPLITFDEPLTFHMDGEDVEVIPMPSAHTDGDTLVRFPKADASALNMDFHATIPRLSSFGKPSSAIS